jgi:hypothetical protein
VNTRESALLDPAVDAVVRAAAAGQPVVVPHRMPADAAGDAAAMRRLAASVPRSWWVASDGAVDALTAELPAQLAPSLPGDGEGAIVTRLYHLQELPAMRPLTDSVYDALERAWPSTEPWLRRDAGFFLSSKDAVTSAHADRHHNLLLQLSGSKEIGVAVPGSRAHAAIVARSVPSLRCCEMPPEAKTFVLPAGSALYMPPYTVHWVRSTDDSVALSCGWSSAATVHAGEVHAANAALLRLGLPARPVGGRSDALRLRAVTAARRLRPAARRA